MVIVQLYGGLGNQMFQYATGRSLANRLSTVLKLDIGMFETYRLHNYSLYAFHIWETIATQQEIKALQARPPQRTLEKIFLRLGRGVGLSSIDATNGLAGTLFRESSFGYDPTLLQTTGNVYLEGYWQSEKYFINLRDTLLREFSVKFAQDEKSKEINASIRATNSVSLHVRRQDYVDDPQAHEQHGVCTNHYYQTCIQYILQRVENPHFFVFSDDPEWVKRNLEISRPFTIIDHNGPSRNFEDLRLMSQCKHHVIANSSFSWWGAWLNTFPGSIVLTPKHWFKDTNRDAKDVIPERWIKIDNL